MMLVTLNFLQNLLLPLLLGALVVGLVAVALVGRKRPAPRQPAARPASQPPATPAAPAPTARASQPPAPAADTHPARAAPPPPAAPAAPTPPAVPLQADLLLVDDSAVVRAKLRRLFEPAGYRLALARDGEEALALLDQGRYALMVTDLEMPRLDGVGLIRATLQRPACAGMPILAITGHEDLQNQLNQLQAVAGIYRKPWIDDDLLSHVQALVQPSDVPAEHTDAG
jgi:CheY-like chemotaxis protein